MSLKAIWASNNPYSKLLLATGIILFSAVFFTLLSSVVASLIYDVGIMELEAMMTDLSNPATISILKFIQSVSAIGIFVVPPLVLAYLFNEAPSSYLSLGKRAKTGSSLFVVCSLLAALPVINFLGEVNAHMNLPSFMSGIESWMKESEAQAAEITRRFLTMDSTSDLLVNLFMIALLPALGEELLFRGLIQRIFLDWSRSKHVAVWVSAVLFSAMHLQFYGFLPRMLLGALFGYLLVWSGSLWLPIIGHFVNNATAVITTYLFQEEMMAMDPDKIGTENDAWLLVASAAVTAAFILAVYRKERDKNYSEEAQ